VSDLDEECSSTAPERRQLRRAQQRPQIRYGLQSTSRDPIKDFADDVLKDSFLSCRPRQMFPQSRTRSSSWSIPPSANDLCRCTLARLRTAPKWSMQFRIVSPPSYSEIAGKLPPKYAPAVFTTESAQPIRPSNCASSPVPPRVCSGYRRCSTETRDLALCSEPKSYPAIPDL
jgi:hypothetical protein